MSNTSSSKELASSLPDVQGFKHDYRHFNVCDDSKNVNMFDRKSFTNYEYPQGSAFPKTYYPDSRESWPSGDEVGSLIESHISKHDELNVNQSIDTKSSNSRTVSNVVECAPTIKTKPSFSKTLDSPTKVAGESTRDERKSKTNPASFHLGQILNRKSGNGPLRTKIPDHSDGENVNSFSRGFVFKKQTESPSNFSENAPEIQVKTKLRTLWNNMKYGWRVKREVNLKLDSETWLLGQRYHNEFNDGPEDVAKELKLDLHSRILLTYRINFPTIPGTDLVTDSGWGCMLRCGQMMMAQALVCHFLHREWRTSTDQPPEKKLLYKMILRWFGDSLSECSPFSLHHLVKRGENYGRKAGDWYGPTHAAQVLRDALIQAKIDHSNLRNLCMYVALDGIVFKQDVMELCLGPVNGLPTILNSNAAYGCLDSPDIDYPEFSSLGEQLCIRPENNLNQNANGHNLQRNVPVPGEDVGTTVEEELSFTDPCPSYTAFGPPSFNTSQSNWKSLILFVSVRLGNDKINPFYIPCLKNLLSYKHCIGIIGGRPKHALYFIGWQADKLIHMDPHSCQPAIDVEKDFNEKSFHSSSIRTMSFSEMDPSCAIGFYFRRKEEFLNFIDKFHEITAPMKKNLDYPVFALAEGKRKDIEEVDMSHSYARSSFSHTNSKTDEDDYILL